MSIVDQLASAALEAEEKLQRLAWSIARGQREPSVNEVNKLLASAGKDAAWFKAMIAEREEAVRAWRRLRAAQASVTEMGSVPPPIPTVVAMGTFRHPGAVTDARQRESMRRTHVLNLARQEWEKVAEKWQPELKQARAALSDQRHVCMGLERRRAELRECLEKTRPLLGAPRMVGIPEQLAFLQTELDRIEPEVVVAQAAVLDAEERVKVLEAELIGLIEGK
ncbi:MAG: hypothetical protein NUV77_04380 [Thermoguttaceae bacterium]|nr:hypothetical protein [Thermoguttaceae bacterium]